MLYAIAGHGTANETETIATLASLKAAAETAGDEFWMILAQPGPEEEISATERAIIAWLQDKAIYWEAVVRGGADQALYTDADEIHQSRSPVDMLIKLAKYRIQPDEKSALLVLSSDIDADESVLFAIERAIESGIPVYDLGGQMTPIQLEAEPEIAVREPEPVTLPTLDATENLTPPDEEKQPERSLLTRENLEKLTRDELKSLARSEGVDGMVRDMRSKEALIVALLGGTLAPEAETLPEPAPEPIPESLKGLTPVEPAEDPTRCYLLIVREDGEEVQRLSQRATMCLMALLADEDN